MCLVGTVLDSAGLDDLIAFFFFKQRIKRIH